MKSTLAWLLLVALQSFGRLGAATNDVYSVRSTNLLTVSIVSGDQAWTPEEMETLASRFLQNSGVMPTNPPAETILAVYPYDPSTMCEVVYLYGFGRPVFRVQLDSKGRVRGYTQETMLEDDSAFRREQARRRNVKAGVQDPKTPRGQ